MNIEKIQYLSICNGFNCPFFLIIFWSQIFSIEFQLSALLSQALGVLIFHRKRKHCDNPQQKVFSIWWKIWETCHISCVFPNIMKFPVRLIKLGLGIQHSVIRNLISCEIHFLEPPTISYFKFFFPTQMSVLFIILFKIYGKWISNELM